MFNFNLIKYQFRHGSILSGGLRCLGTMFITFLGVLTSLQSWGQVSVTASAGTAGPTSYATLNDAFVKINDGTHQGAITVQISANTTEVAACILNSTGSGLASYTSVSIYPTTDGVVISGPTVAGRGLIELNGADNVTIDGDNPNTTGTNRNLTISNTAANTVAYASVIRVAAGTVAPFLDNNNLIIRNLILNGNATSRNASANTSTTASENTTFGVAVGPNGAAVPTAITSVSTTVNASATVNNFVVSNCAINQVARGISFLGSSATSSNSVTISNNTIGGAGTLTGVPPFTSPASTVYTKGILVQGLTSLAITGNTIQNIVSYVGTTLNGIELASAIGATGGTVNISSNTITGVVNNGSSRANAILVSSATVFANVSNNIISYVQTTGSASASGIGFSSSATVVPGSVISYNKISTVYARSTGGYAASGILISAGNNANILNNVIWDLLAVNNNSTTSTSFAVKGISLASGIGHKVYHNTVHLTGTLLGASTAADNTTCLMISATSQTGIDISNNIFSNTITSNAAVANACLQLPSGATSAMNLTLNNNAYYTGTSANHYVAILQSTFSGYTAANFLASSATPATNLRAYTSTLSASGLNDNTSFATSSAAPFKSATDLLIDVNQTSVVSLYRTGAALTSVVATDIEGQTRNATPCLGADEFQLSLCSGTPTPGSLSSSPMTICSGQSANLILSGATIAGGVTYQWKVSTTAGGPYTNFGLGGVSQNTGNLTATSYFVCDVVCTVTNTTVTTPAITVTVNANPTVTINASALKYCGTPLTLTASGADTYSWSPSTNLSASTGASVTAILTANRNYTVTGVNTFGCSAINTVAVTLGNVITLSSITATPSSACSGSTSRLSAIASLSQTANLYTFASSTGASLDPMTSATSLLASGVDDAASALTTFPSGFIFPYEGINYTQFSANSNGVLRLGGTLVSSTQYGSVTGQTLLLSPAGADMGTGSDGGVSYLITGTAPNRIFIVQHKVAHTWSTSLAINNTFQTWLYETSGKIEYVYGAMASSGTPAHGIGISGASTSNYQSVNVATSASSTGSVTSNTTLPASGVKYTFTPPVTTLTYNWSSSQTSTSLSSTSVSNPTATMGTASTNFMVTISEANGCSISSAVSVTLGGGTPSVTITNSGTASICPSTSVTLSAAIVGGCSPFTYVWSTGATTSNIVANPMVNTTYTVTVSDVSSLSATATYSLSVFSATTVTVSPSMASVCAGTPVMLTANGGVSYAWSVNGSTAVTGLFTNSGATATYVAGANQNPIYARPTATTIYSVTATDANGCKGSATKAVNVYGAMATTITATPPTICTGDTSRLNVTANLALGYSFGSVSYSPIATPATGAITLCDAGVASVVLTSGSLDDGYWNNISLPFPLRFNGQSYTTIGIGTNGVIGLGSLTNTSGYSNTLPSTSAANPSFAPFYLDLDLDDPTAGSISYFLTGTAPNRKFVVTYTNVPVYSVAGTHTFQAIINEDGSFESHIQAVNATGSTGTRNASVAVILSGASAFASRNNAVNTTFVNNEAWKFTALTPSYSYVWNTPTTPTTISSTTVPNPLISNFGGTESYNVTITEATSGCSAVASTTITLSTLPISLVSVLNSNPSYCVGNSSVLGTNMTGGCQPYRYAWSTGLTTAAITVSPLATTSYSVTITDKNGASVSGATTVTVNNPQPASTTNATRCGAGTATLRASKTLTTDSLSWYTAMTGGTKVGNGTSFSTSLPVGTSTYYVAAEQIFGTGSAGKLAPEATWTSFVSTNWGIVFDVISPTTLNSVDVYSTTAGTLDVKIMDASLTTELFSTGTVNVAAGGVTTPTAIPLNFSIPAGTGYRLVIKASSGVNLVRGSTNLAFPYNTGVVNVTASEWGGTTTGTYYYFYNLKFNTICSGTRVPVTATVNELPSGTATPTPVACNGGATGSAQVVGSGATTPYTYNWSNGSTQSSATGLTAGTYTATVISSVGCASLPISTTVTEPTALASTITATNISCNAAANGLASASVSGGIAPYTYNWSNSATGASITGLSPNTYALTITDANACKSIKSVTITQPTAITINPMVTAVTCRSGSNGAIMSMASGGTGTLTYLWSNAATTANITGLTTGSYTVVVKDANNCTATNSVTITQPSAITVTATTQNISCNGGATGSASLSSSGGTGAISYLWSNGRTTNTITGLTVGNYSVTGTDANGCTIGSAVTITQPSALAVTTSVSNVSGNGLSNGSINLTAAGGSTPYRFNWNTGSTTKDITGLIAGTYAATITDANGCSTVASGIQITQPQPLVVSPNISNNQSSSDIQLNVTGGVSPYTYNWSNGATSSSLTGIAGGNYTVTVTDAQGNATTLSLTTQPTSVDNVTLLGALSIYPNPTKGTVWAKITMPQAETVTCHLFDANGKLLITQEIKASNEPTFQLDLSNFEAGFYFARFTTGAEVITKRIILTSNN